MLSRAPLLGATRLMAVALVVAASCGRSPDRGAAETPAADPCDGKACGAACRICPASDPACSKGGVAGYCGENGTCALPYPVCPAPPECTADGDCPVIAMCAVCPDGSAACPQGRCVEGRCTTYFPPCPAECATAADCPDVGMPCQLCADGTVSCPASSCEGGQCVVSFPRCDGHDPCAGKACGAACTLCDPADPGCAETAVLKYCDVAGRCMPAFPVCEDVCALPADPGPCEAAMQRWYFDVGTGRCTTFVYGGCQGNGNNFTTIAGCLDACAPAADPPCSAVTCPPDASCVYQGDVPTCATPCAPAGSCPVGLSCGCASSCPFCKDCANVCLPAP